MRAMRGSLALSWLHRSSAVVAAAALLSCAGGGGRLPPPEPVPEPDGPVVASTTGRGPYEKPRSVAPHCVERNVRMTPEILGGHSGPITVKFAVMRDGGIARFEALSRVPDAAAAEIERAVRSCEWIPGTDRQGRPTGVWIILPLRFAAAR